MLVAGHTAAFSYKPCTTSKQLWIIWENGITAHPCRGWGPVVAMFRLTWMRAAAWWTLAWAWKLLLRVPRGAGGSSPERCWCPGWAVLPGTGQRLKLVSLPKRG